MSKEVNRYKETETTHDNQGNEVIVNREGWSEHEIIASIKAAREVLGAAKMVWELHRVDGSGIRMRLIYTDTEGLKLSDVANVVRDLKIKAINDMALLVQDGLPLNLAKRALSDATIGTSNGRLAIGIDVLVSWLSGQGLWGWKDVEEIMMEAGIA